MKKHIPGQWQPPHYTDHRRDFKLYTLYFKPTCVSTKLCEGRELPRPYRNVGMEFDQEMLPLEAQFANFGPVEGVNLRIALQRKIDTLCEFHNILD